MVGSKQQRFLRFLPLRAVHSEVIPAHRPDVAVSCRTRWLWRGLVWSWGAALCVAFCLLAVYGQRAGHPVNPPHFVPTGVLLAPGGYTLVLVIHPKCPCSQASLYELERLAARCGEGLSIRIFVFQPRSADPQWSQAVVASCRARFPAAKVLADPDGQLAERLGCVTSGAVVLYAADGSVQFRGGITSARGHAGDNLGSDSIAAIVAGRPRLKDTTPVYGCPVTGDCARDSGAAGREVHE